MASAIEHITECPVCTLVFTDPKVLPCDHSFCQSCIDRLRKGPTIKCPVCTRVYDAASVRPDFRLTQFLDALKEKEAEQKNTTNKEDPQCELCCEESGHHWCEDCQQWMCLRCKNTHLRASQCRNHTFLTLPAKAEQIKASFNDQTQDIRDSMDKIQGDIRKLEQSINKLESTQSEALTLSHDLREKTHKEIDEHFDSIDLQILQAMNSKIEVLERAKTAINTDFKNLQTHFASLNQMICVNERKLVMDGDSLMEQAITLCKIVEAKEALVPSPLNDEVEISLSRSQTWDPVPTILSIQTSSNGDPKKIGQRSNDDYNRQSQNPTRGNTKGACRPFQDRQPPMRATNQDRQPPMRATGHMRTTTNAPPWPRAEQVDWSSDNGDRRSVGYRREVGLSHERRNRENRNRRGWNQRDRDDMYQRDSDYKHDDGLEIDQSHIEMIKKS